MQKSKGSAPIIVGFRIVIGIIGLFLLLDGLGNVNDLISITNDIPDESDGLTGFNIIFSNTVGGPIKIIVGLSLIVLCVNPESFIMIVNAVLK